MKTESYVEKVDGPTKEYHEVFDLYRDYCKIRQTRKNLEIGWLSKKLHIRGVQFFYYFGVHMVRRNDRKIVTTNKMKSFYDAIKLDKLVKVSVMVSSGYEKVCIRLVGGS